MALLNEIFAKRIGTPDGGHFDVFQDLLLKSHDGRDAHSALMLALIDEEIAHKEGDRGAAGRLRALHTLIDEPEALEDLVGSTVTKSFDASKHPRGKGGQWSSVDVVAPDHAAKFAHHAAKQTDPGKVDEFHDVAKRNVGNAFAREWKMIKEQTAKSWGKHVADDPRMAEVKGVLNEGYKKALEYLAEIHHSMHYAAKAGGLAKPHNSARRESADAEVAELRKHLADNYEQVMNRLALVISKHHGSNVSQIKSIIIKGGKHDESKHPRDSHGRWISKDAIADAKDALKSGDHREADALRERVTDPEQRAKLDAALAGEHDLGRTKAGEKRAAAGQKRQTKESAAARVRELRIKAVREGLGLDDLRELTEHLPHLTVDDLKKTRIALGASFHGDRKKEAMLERLKSWASASAEHLRDDQSDSMDFGMDAMYGRGPDDQVAAGKRGREPQGEFDRNAADAKKREAESAVSRDHPSSTPLLFDGDAKRAGEEFDRLISEPRSGEAKGAAPSPASPRNTSTPIPRTGSANAEEEESRALERFNRHAAWAADRPDNEYAQGQAAAAWDELQNIRGQSSDVIESREAYERTIKKPKIEPSASPNTSGTVQADREADVAATSHSAKVAAKHVGIHDRVMNELLVSPLLNSERNNPKADWHAAKAAAQEAERQAAQGEAHEASMKHLEAAHHLDNMLNGESHIPSMATPFKAAESLTSGTVAALQKIHDDHVKAAKAVNPELFINPMRRDEAYAKELAARKTAAESPSPASSSPAHEAWHNAADEVRQRANVGRATDADRDRVGELRKQFLEAHQPTVAHSQALDKAYDELNADGSHFVSLADLRQKLHEHGVTNRGDQDAALHRARVERKYHLKSQEGFGSTAEETAASIPDPEGERLSHITRTAENRKGGVPAAATPSPSPTPKSVSLHRRDVENFKGGDAGKKQAVAAKVAAKLGVDAAKAHDILSRAKVDYADDEDFPVSVAFHGAPPAPPPSPPVASSPGDEPSKRIHGRTPVEGKSEVHFTRSGKNAATPGEIIRTKDGQRHVVTNAETSHVSDDWIEDNDAWHTYKDGPGHYTHITAVPVHDTPEEKTNDERDATAKQRKSDDVAAKKKAGGEAWQDVANHQVLSSLPDGIDRNSLKWETVLDGTSSGVVGLEHRIATLPGGEKIGHRINHSHDDHRESYHVPQSVIDKHADRTNSANHLRKIEYASRSYGDRPEGMTQQQAAAEFDRLAAEHHAKYGDLPAGKSSAMKQREKEALAHVSHFPEAVRSVIDRHPESIRALNDYAASGTPEALANYKATAVGHGNKVKADNDAAYQAAHAEWHPKIASEFGSAAADNIAASIQDDVNSYSHANPRESFQKEHGELVKRKAKKESAKESTPASSGGYHEVTGNTYPVKEQIKRLGGRWNNGRWLIPANVVHKLPRGLSSRPFRKSLTAAEWLRATVDDLGYVVMG